MRLIDELAAAAVPLHLTPRIPEAVPAVGVVYRGASTRHWTYIAIYMDTLRRLWADFPEKRDAMAEALGRYGNTRAYIARSLSDLFKGQSTDWARGHSRTLVADWLVDTNLSGRRIRSLLPVAVKAAGLQWGSDVVAYWPR